MPIESDEQLRTAVFEAGVLLQDIQDYCERENVVQARVRFPRRYLLTAAAYRRLLPNLPQPLLAKNISYALMTADLLAWLAIRTDLSGQAFEMIVKEGICVLASICESLTRRQGVRGLGKKKVFSERTETLVQMGVISNEAKCALDRIWEIRKREHLSDLRDTDYNQYSRTDFNRARAAYIQLVNGLKNRYG